MRFKRLNATLAAAAAALIIATGCQGDGSSHTEPRSMPDVASAQWQSAGVLDTSSGPVSDNLWQMEFDRELDVDQYEACAEIYDGETGLHVETICDDIQYDHSVHFYLPSPYEVEGLKYAVIYLRGDNGHFSEGVLVNFYVRY